MGKNTIIKDFDQFRSLNEDQSLFSFLTTELGSKFQKSLEESIYNWVMEYFGVPTDSQNPATIWILEMFKKIAANMPKSEMDDVLEGRQLVDDGEFWVPKITEALLEVIKDRGPHPAQIVGDWLGLDTNKFLGRLLMNAIRDNMYNENKLKRNLLSIWNLVAEEEFIPREEAGDVYKEAIGELTDEQKLKAKKSGLWNSAIKQADILKSTR
jgi:hypothetical protein